MPELDPLRDPRNWSTLLFVPADKPEMIVRAQTRGADAIIIDLEDAIAPTAKEAARISFIEQLRAGALYGPSAVCVRINALDSGGLDDLEALNRSSIAAVITPKTESVTGVVDVRQAIDTILPAGKWVSLIPQVESARGIVQLDELAMALRIHAIALGGEDLCVDLGVARSEDSLELLVPRALVALHARAMGLPAIDTVYTGIHDPDGLARETMVARKLGFTGKLLIHPRQIETVRALLRPTDDQVRWAQMVLDAIDNGDGGGGVALVDGRMVDAPVIAQARRILAVAR